MVMPDSDLALSASPSSVAAWLCGCTLPAMGDMLAWSMGWLILSATCARAPGISRVVPSRNRKERQRLLQNFLKGPSPEVGAPLPGLAGHSRYGGPSLTV